MITDNTLDIAYKEKEKALKCYKDLERVEKTIKEIEEARSSNKVCMKNKRQVEEAVQILLLSLLSIVAGYSAGAIVYSAGAIVLILADMLKSF